MLAQFCDEHGVPVRRCGKVVVTTDDKQLVGLRQLHERGIANGVDVQLIDEAGLAELEPLARTVGQALWSPTTSVADPHLVIEALAEQVRTSGGEIRLSSPVESGGDKGSFVHALAAQDDAGVGDAEAAKNFVVTFEQQHRAAQAVGIGG